MLMRCPVCGGEHRDDVLYCPYTGARLLFRERLSLPLLIVIVLTMLAAKSCKRPHYKVEQPHFAHHYRQRISKSAHTKAATLNESNTAKIERLVFDLVNNERKRHGLAELAWHDGLAVVARSHSQNMASRGFFSHVDPIEGDFDERLKRHSLMMSVAAENIFCCYGLTDCNEVALNCVQSWMSSRGHRKNILLKETKFSGVGAAHSNDGKIYITQIFAAP